MTSFQERFSELKVKKYIPLFVVGKPAIFTGFLIYMMQEWEMTTQERIKAAELRIKELQTLIQYLKNEKWNLRRSFSKN